MVEVMKIMVTSFKSSHAHVWHSLPPTLKQATAESSPCQRLLGSDRHVWVSNLGGHCSFLLIPGVQKVLFVPLKSLFPQSWWLYGGVNVDLHQEVLCHTQVCCTQSPCGRPLLTCPSTGDTQTHFWLGLCGSGVHFVPFARLSSSGPQVLAEHAVPSGLCVSRTPPHPCPIPAARFPTCAGYLFWRTELTLNPPGRCQLSGISGSCR